MRQETKKMFIFCAVVAVSIAVATADPLPRVSATPLNVDPKLDCAIKELAWEYAKKLLPQQGSFQSAYDALSLKECGVSLSRGPRYEKRPLLHQPAIKDDAMEVYVDVNKGSDSNAGTLDSPLKTVFAAVKLLRFRRSDTRQQAIIYLRQGTYFLADTIRLGPEDSNLVVTAYKSEKVVVSGGKEYKFTGLWKEYVNRMGPILAGVNAIYDSAVSPGESNGKAWYYGKVSSPQECQTACEKNSSCFAFTYHDNTTGAYSNMCYFRVDGLWAPYNQTGHYSGKKQQILMANLSGQDPIPFTTLFINGRRAIRARYPDANPETMGLHTNPTGYVPTADKYLPPPTFPPAKEIHVESPERNGTHFPQFQIGVGGPVSMFVPPESYWGTKNPSGGGGSTYKVPSGIQYSKNERFAYRNWLNPQDGVVHMYQGPHWGNWQFRIAERDAEMFQLLWTYGGFQEARGSTSGAEWYVENIFEELDAPGEWFYNDKERTLYFFPNGTAPEEGIGTVLDQLFEFVDSEDIIVMGLTFAHTATTFFKDYEVPSGGDWAIHRGGAVFVEGVDGFLIQNCLFDAPGGNGLFLSNYVRNAIVEGNEFIYMGDSAIAAIGSAELIDGTDGNQPRGTVITGNLMHEIGIFGKQTAGYVQSLACQTNFTGNVIFNGPRAGINFNDGFGGGNLVKNNLIFNMVRETGDHGDFNSWDRQPYLTEVKNGTPSLTPAQSNMTRNFFINNYHSTWPIDHDDGSCYYYDTFNYLIYGGYKNYLGHTKIVQSNVYIYPDALHSLDESRKAKAFLSRPFCANSDGASTGEYPSGWGEVWTNNTCAIGNPIVYEYDSCTTTGSNKGLVPFTANNTFYAPTKLLIIQCGGKNLTFADWQKEGYDLGSVVNDPVDTDTIIQWGRQLLGL